MAFLLLVFAVVFIAWFYKRTQKPKRFPPGVNFINTFWSTFFIKEFLSKSFMGSQFGFVFSWQKEIVKKSAIKCWWKCQFHQHFSSSFFHSMVLHASVQTILILVSFDHLPITNQGKMFIKRENADIAYFLP